MEENPYKTPQTQSPAPSVKMPHSRRGIASFVLALVCVVTVFGAFVTAAITDTKQRGTATAIVGGLAIWGSLLDLIAIAMGADALLLHCRERRKLFAVLGVVVGLALLAFVAGVIVLGLTLGVRWPTRPLPKIPASP